MKELNENKSIVKVELPELCTVEDVVKALSDLPQDYEFLCAGYDDKLAIAIDNDFGKLSIDREVEIDKMIEAITFDNVEDNE